MRNAKVFVILLGRVDLGPGGEEGRSALGLYHKYHDRVVDGVTQQVELIAVKKLKGDGWHTVDTSLKETQQGKLALADGDKIGMYLVGHAQDYATHKPVNIITSLLAERIAAAAKVDDEVKKGKKRAIRVELDKLCLVLCLSGLRTINGSITDNVKAPEQPLLVIRENEKKSEFKKRLQEDIKAYGHETSLLADICRRLAEEGLRPRVAGYTGAITAVGPDDVGEDGLTKGNLFTQKLRVGQKTPNTDTTSKKLYFVYEAEKGYMQKDVAAWTDKA